MPESYPKEIIAAAKAASDALPSEVRSTPIGQVAVCPDCIGHVQRFGGDLKLASEAAAAASNVEARSVVADYMVTFHNGGHTA